MRYIVLASLSAFLMAPQLGLCQRSPIVAKIADETVTVADVDSYIKGQPTLNRKVQDRPEVLGAVRKRSLSTLVNTKVLLRMGRARKAIDERKVKSIVSKALAARGGAETIARRLRESGADFRYYQHEMAQQVRLTQVLEHIMKDVEVKEPSEEALRKAFAKNRTSFVKQKRWELKVIELELPDDLNERGKARSKVTKVVKEMKIDTDMFERSQVNLKKTFGVGGRSGYFGWARKGMLAPILEREVLSLAEGDVSKPVFFQKKLFIFKVLKVEQRNMQPSFEDSKDELRKDLETFKRTKLVAKIVKDLKKKYKVKEEPEKFSGVKFASSI